MKPIARYPQFDYIIHWLLFSHLQLLIYILHGQLKAATCMEVHGSRMLASCKIKVTVGIYIIMTEAQALIDHI